MYKETTQRPRKARKDSICDECKTTIAKGTIAIVNSALINGKYEPMRRHADCIEAAEIIEAEVSNRSGLRLFLVPMIREYPSINFKLNEILADFPEVLDRLTKNSGISPK